MLLYSKTPPEEISIHTAKMRAIKTAMRKINEREDIRWAMYTDSLNSMLAIKNNSENHPILNQIYDILTELHNQGKEFTLCKVPVDIEGKENVEADRSPKQAIGMPGMITTRLPYTDTYLTIRRTGNSK